MTETELKALIKKVDYQMICESMQAIASEGILQGNLNATKGYPIDNSAIRERVIETMTLIISEISAAKIFEIQDQ